MSSQKEIKRHIIVHFLQQYLLFFKDEIQVSLQNFNCINSSMEAKLEKKKKLVGSVVNKTPNNGDQSKAFHGHGKDNEYFSAILRQ